MCNRTAPVAVDADARIRWREEEEMEEQNDDDDDDDADGRDHIIPPPPRVANVVDGVVVPPRSASPLGRIDPVVRALNTVMFGLVVHFGTIWYIDDHVAMARGGVGVGVGVGVGGDRDCHPIIHPTPPSSSPSHTYYSILLMNVLFHHEYWVYLQHVNVFANPLLQHLDRRYGIALLRSNGHWSIAGTLSAYWAREALGMFCCLPFLECGDHHCGAFTTTQYLILYSIAYHSIKSRGVRSDAMHRSSSRFGIMTLVIDDFHLHEPIELVVSLVRLALQGMDAYVHYRIVRDMATAYYRDDIDVVVVDDGGDRIPAYHATMGSLFAIWVMHAALNQLFRCSTASVAVRAWHALTSSEGKNRTPCFSGDGIPSPADDDDDDGDRGRGGGVDRGGRHVDDADVDEHDDDFVVRRLLRRDRVDGGLKGGTASDCVDKAVRFETAIAVLSAFFMIGIGCVPLGALSATASTISSTHPFEIMGDPVRGVRWEGRGRRRMTSAAVYAWVLWSLLHGIWATFLRSPRHHRRRSTDETHPRGGNSVTMIRVGSLLRLLDVGVLLVIGALELPPDRRRMMLFACSLLTAKAFFRSLQYPRIIHKGLSVAEFATKTLILRLLTNTSPDATSISSVLAIVWVVWVVFNPVPTPCEIDASCRSSDDAEEHDVADAVFLGHPAYLSDAWALWLLPYPLRERWSAPWWTWPLWPVHYLVGWYVCVYRRRLYGDGAAFFCCDDSRYGQIRMQNWVASHFGRHFVTHPRQVKANIEACARHAEKVGVKVLCLGALNKSESINGGGIGVVKALGPNRRLSVIHGNHLTAAAVVRTVSQCFGERRVKLFLTGASSKVGWAVAQALRDRHDYDILCHSTDPGRRKYFEQNGFASASTLAEGSAHSKYWIVGKYDLQLCDVIPQNAVVIVFSVPHPLESRRDLRVIEAGTLHMDLSRLDRPRVFANKLKEHEIFACHAAGIVAAFRLEHRKVLRIDEVGPVDINEMDSWLDDANRIGFSVPKCDPRSLARDNTPVVIVGGGPSGLSVAAYLSQKRIPHILLEAENDQNLFGSWAYHFTGLEITTQKKWCTLPGFSMNDKDFPNETVTAIEYQRYLKQYAHRYAINIRRGATVISVEKGSEKYPFLVKYRVSTGIGSTETAVEIVRAWSVVIATGKHRIPRSNTSDDIIGKLEPVGMAHFHSTDMCNDAIWMQAIRAAQEGRLCIIGFGNSAADLATMILLRCNEDDGSDSAVKTKIHVAAQSIPPIFPRRYSFLRVDTLGFILRLLPETLQDILVKVLCAVIPGSKTCQSAFPSYLKRWNKIKGRVPVIDKHGMLAKGFQSGRLVGHGPISHVTKGRVHFNDGPTVRNGGTEIDMVILATGYRDDCIVEREDRLNGLYKCGFSKSDRFLPLLSISEDAKGIADDIAASYCNLSE